MEQVIVIGNGEKALRNKKRELIDSSHVVRINRFHSEGYEDYIGTRTDFYACTKKNLELLALTEEQKLAHTERQWLDNLEKYPQDIQRHQNVELESLHQSYLKIYRPPPLNVSTLKEIWCLWSKDKQEISSPFLNKIMVSDILFEEQYSTGFRCILYVMKRFPDAKIFITGFDSFVSSGWYWDDQNKLANKVALTDGYTDGHPYIIESVKIRSFLSNGLITEI